VASARRRRAPVRRRAPQSIVTPADSGFPAAPDHQGDIAPHVRAVLAAIGEDPRREGLEKTPTRVEKAFRFLTKGYREDVSALLNSALFTVSYDEMVVVKDIDAFSLCEHHLLPFFGKAHVAYIPKGRVIGLSKIPRLVDAFARRLQVQERLTVQIAQALQDAIQPRGVGVVIEAMHFCMIMRGVEKQNSVAVTSCMLGAFRDQVQTREEFLALIRKKHNGLG
jgi:GTP cyclohydrolase IA